MSSKEKPYVLIVAELIYLEVCKLKKENPYLNNIDAIEAFIGSKTYKHVSSGKFHDEWFVELKKNKFIDAKTKKKDTRRNNKIITSPERCYHKTINSISRFIFC